MNTPPLRWPSFRPLLVLLALSFAVLGRAMGSFVIESITGGGATYLNGYPVAYARYSDDLYGVTYPMVNCGGTITAVLKWQANPRDPSEPIPPKAIVWQGCIVTRGLGAACDNTMGDPYVGDTRGESSSGSGNPIYHPVVRTPDAQGRVTVTLTPTASGSEENPGATVRYRVHANPMKIELSGVLDPKTDKRLLIGQKLGATVSGAPSGANTYTWIVGGGPFTSYTPSVPASQFVGYNPPNASSDPSTACCFRSPGAKSVQCSVYLAASGQTVTLSENVTAVAPDFQAWATQGQAELSNGLRLWGATYDDRTRRNPTI